MQLPSARRSISTTANHPDVSTLNDFVDGVLSASVMKTLTAHVDGCTVCRQIVANLGDLIATARAEGQQLVRAPAGLWATVTASTIHRQAIWRSLLIRNRWQLALLSFLLIATGAAVGVSLATGCVDAKPGREASRCNGSWYQVLQYGTQERAKQLRDYATAGVKAERKRLQHWLSR